MHFLTVNIIALKHRNMSIPSITRKLIVSQSPRLLGLETFSSSDLWTPSGRSLVFGGQVVAQAMMAASHTTEKEVHSQHVR